MIFHLLHEIAAQIISKFLGVFIVKRTDHNLLPVKNEDNLSNVRVLFGFSDHNKFR